MTITPKLLTLSLFFGSCQPLAGTICLLIFVTVYSILFFSITYPIYQKLKTEDNAGQYRLDLIRAFLSSVVSPSIVIHPKTKTICVSNFASTCAHLILISFLILFPTYLDVQFKGYDFEIFCYALLGLHIVSPIFSWVLNRYSKETSCSSVENNALFLLEVINGNNIENNTRESK